MIISIDAIDGGWARIDFGGTAVEVPSEALPCGAKEGDILEFVKKDGASIKVGAADRISRMSALSGGSADELDI